MNVEDVLKKYRVSADSECDGTWLYLDEWRKGFMSEEYGWRPHYSHGDLHPHKWRISGGYIMPSMWFKSLKERIHIAVGYAVAIVKDELAKTLAKERADELAEKWTAYATGYFEEALKNALKEG